MTKNINSNNNLSSNKNNKKKNVKNDSINNADKIMEELYTELNSEEMGMEQFQKVLEQIADHSLPESEKLPLVQKLNQEHAKEDNCLEDVIKSNQTSKTKLKNLQRKTTTKLNNLINDTKLENNCEQQLIKESHLQKLENYCDRFVNNNCTSTSLTNSLLNNCNHNQLNRLNNDQIMSNEMYLQNSTFNKSLESSQINKECDNLKCEHRKNRLLFNVSNTNENFENYEFKDYSRQAQLVEYTSALKYADLKDNNDLNEHKLELLIKNKDLKSTTANHYDQSNQLKYNLVNTQYAEKILDDELKDSNRNYSSDCLNRYQTNLIDNQSHAKLSSSTSDGYISSMNTYFDNDNKSSNFQLNSNYLKKGSTSSSIQTNGKSENNHLKKKKKPEKKLTQHCQGYVGYLDVNFLTNYITGNKTTDMRNQINSTNNTKEMNLKKKDKLNNLNNNKQNKKNGQSTAKEETDNDLNQSNNQSNDKNNNLTIATNSSSTLDNTATNSITNSITNSTNIIPNSSINQLTDNSRKNSIDKITNENNQNMNNQTKQNSKSDKKLDNKKFTPSSNQSRKSSAASNFELNNNQKLTNQGTKDDKLINNSDNAKTANSSIVSNGGIDPMYIVSDSEVPDQEGDFKIVKYKNLRRKKQKKSQDELKLTNQQNKEIIKQKKFNNQNKQNPATARGYESESDYCAVEGRKRESNLKRDILIDDKKQQNHQQQQNNNNNKNSISDSGSSINSQQTNEENNQQTLNESSINTKATTKLPQQQTNFTATYTNQPQFTNPNIPYSKISTNSNKISYAAITKMNYSNNNTTALQIATANNNTTNLINSDDNLTQVRTQIGEEIINKKQINKNDNKSIKSINTNEQNIKKTDDKKSNDKESKKIIHLDNSNSDNNYESKEINYNNLSDDNSRTITATSIDYQFTSESSSKTSNSFNTTPPVIMLDEKNSNQDTKFTFGFFDENDKLSASNLDDESNDDFKTINIDSVNFISNNKEPSNNSIINSSLSYQSNTSLNETNNVSSLNKNLDSSTAADNIDSTLSSSSIVINTNNNNDSTTNLSTSSNTTSTTNNSTQFCQGTYIMNCDNNEDSSSLRDNITKHVNTNQFNKSSVTLANEITSFNLTKFIKEKIPSPIISEVNHNQLNLNYQNLKYHQPDFKKSVTFVKTVNYIRKGWEETLSNPNAVYI